MKCFRRYSALLCVPVLMLCSCMSTREYLKTEKTLYQNDVVIEENYEFRQDNKLKEKRNKKFYELSDVCSETTVDDKYLTVNSFTAVKESTSKSSTDEITFTLMEYRREKGTKGAESRVLGTKKVKAKEGKLSGEPSEAKGDVFSGPMEKFFRDNVKKMVSAIYEAPKAAKEETDSKPAKMQEVATSEKVIVESVPNGKYIFYQIAGKPFVITGVAAWNVLKCGGYALLNFLGGYNFVASDGKGTLWTLPSYKKSKEKAVKAKEANRIKYYPEYHMMFTNNHIIVEKYDRDISVLALSGENAEEIVPKERYEYDNTMSVTRSSAADAASTAGVGGVIGTVVTIPVSVTTWVGGVLVGVYAETQK